MSRPKFLVASVLGVAALSANAGVTFNFSADAEGSGSTSDYARRDAVAVGNLLTTGGTLTAAAAGVQSSVNASTDPTTGMFKALTRIDIDGGYPHAVGQSYARLDTTDMLRFTGPGPTVVATFSLNYDTAFSGLGFAAFNRAEGDGGYHFQQASSNRSITLDYQVANPNYDPTLVCSYEGDAVFCPPEAQPTLSFSDRAYKELESYTALDDALYTTNYTYSFGNVGNGRYTGVVTLSAVLPTDVDVTLSYFAINSARCFGLPSCSLVIDAGHSDYLGLQVEGGSFVSANGYQYAGLPPAVPEPQTAALLLAGLALVGGALRRRRG